MFVTIEWISFDWKNFRLLSRKLSRGRLLRRTNDSPRLLPLSREQVHLIIAEVREHRSAEQFKHLPRLAKRHVFL